MSAVSNVSLRVGTPLGRVLYALCFAFVPILGFHLFSLWERSHYRFAIVVVVLIAGLLFQRAREREAPSRSFLRLRHVGLTFALLACLAASVRFEPWLAGIGLLCAFGAGLLLCRAAVWIDNSLGIWLLAATLVPLPVQLDSVVTGRLRHASGVLASGFLQTLRVPNEYDGAFLSLASGERFSLNGFLSDYFAWPAFVAFALLICVLRNRPLVHALAMCVAGLAWSVALNSFRLIMLAMLPNASAPVWVWNALLATFAFLGVLLLDRLMEWMFFPVPTDSAQSVQENKNFIQTAWNFIVRLGTPLPPKRLRSGTVAAPLVPTNDGVWNGWAAAFAFAGVVSLVAALARLIF